MKDAIGFLPALVLIVLLLNGCASIPAIHPPVSFFSGKELGIANFSPDGRRLVFSLKSSNTNKLYLVDVDGTGLKDISGRSTFLFDPSFSPDGTKILFSQISGGDSSICAMNIDGLGKRCLTSGPEHDYDPVYSPDGQKIYFLRAREFTNYSPVAVPAWHNIDIFSIDTDGTDLRRVTTKSLYRAGSLSVDGSGESMMLTATGWRKWSQEYLPESPVIDFFVKNPAEYAVVTPNLEEYREKVLLWKYPVDYMQIRNAQLSPARDELLFTWPFNQGIFVMNRKNGLVKRVWRWNDEGLQLGHMHPRFSRDGSRIVFSTMTRREGLLPGVQGYEASLWIINADGTGLRRVEVK